MSERRIKVITDVENKDPNIPMLRERLGKAVQEVRATRDRFETVTRLKEALAQTFMTLKWNNPETGYENGYSVDNMANDFLLWLMMHQQDLQEKVNSFGDEYEQVIPYTRAYIFALTNDDEFSREVQEIVKKYANFEDTSDEDNS